MLLERKQLWDIGPPRQETTTLLMSLTQPILLFESLALRSVYRLRSRRGFYPAVRGGGFTTSPWPRGWLSHNAR